MSKYLKVINTVGYICVFVAAAMLLPVICALCYKEYSVIPSFLITLSGAALLGVITILLTKKHSKADIGIKYSAVIVVASWLTVILISSLPILFVTDFNFSQAFFESTSGWTTTGLTLVDVSAVSKSILLWRSVTQFLGGIGVIFVLQIVLPNPRTAMLYNSEGHSELVLPNIKKTLKFIGIIYFSYTVLGIMLYLFGGMSFFDSLNHSMTAVSTGGFSTQKDSIGAYNSVYIEAVTIFLMLLGSINFSVHILLFTGKFKTVAKFFEMRVSAVILIVFLPLMIFAGLLPTYNSIGTSVRLGVFETVSALSTTGFTLTSRASWSGFAIIGLVFLMLIGGNSGSTAGGIKLYRIGLMGKSFYWNLKSKLNDANKVFQPYIYNTSGKQFIKHEEISVNNTAILLYLFMWLIGAFLISAFGYSMGDSIFEFAGVIGNAGISVGITNATLSPGALWIMIVGMLFARLESGVILLAAGKIFSDISKRIRR